MRNCADVLLAVTPVAYQEQTQSLQMTRVYKYVLAEQLVKLCLENKKIDF